MSETLYPLGYGTQLVTFDVLRAKHINNMHPVFADRLFAWLKAQNGLVGIGGGFRLTQPVKPGFAEPGKSFHQLQQFPSGQYYCAVDLVVSVPGSVHRAPKWSEVPEQGSVEASQALVHCNISTEPWHMQPVELDGWQRWVNAGRPDLKGATKPGPWYGTWPYTTKPLTRYGAKGDVVKYLQAVLNLANQNVTVDGSFGPQTQTAVLNVQRFFNLTVDGIVGKNTWHLIDTLALELS